MRGLCSPPGDQPGHAAGGSELYPDGNLDTWARGVANRLIDTFASVAKAEGCLFLDAGARSSAHHAWSSTPWIRQFHLTLRGAAPYHPNAAGMTAVADMLIEKIT